MFTRALAPVITLLWCAVAAPGWGAEPVPPALNQRYLEAVTKLEAGDAAGAVASATSLLEKDRRFPEAWRLRALAKWQLNDLRGALADATQALALNAKDADTYRARAGIKQAQGDLTGAVADFDQAIQLEPARAEYYGGRAYVHFKHGDMEAALRDFNRTIELAPEAPAPIYFYRGQVNELLGEGKAALADYDVVVRKDPGEPAVREFRSWLRFKLRDWDGSADDAQKVLQKQPQNASAWRALGCAQFARGDYRAAIESLGRGAAILGHKDPAAASPLLLRHLAQQRIDTQADGLLEQAAPTWPKAEWQQSLAAFLAGKLTEERLDALAEGPGTDTEKRERQCEAHFYIGMTRLMAGDRPTARVRLKASIATDVRDFVEYILSQAELERWK